MATDQETLLELRFRPSFALVGAVRRFVSELYDRSFRDPDAASRLALATHELLENGAKYSSDGETYVRVAIGREGKDSVLSLTTANRASEAHRERVRLAFAGMDAAGDAAAHFQELLLRDARRPEVSGLGLARVRAEAGMALACEIAGERVAIVASARIASPTAGGGGEP